jgi:hypothetical protein
MDAAFVRGRGGDAKLSGIQVSAKSGRLCRNNLPSDPRVAQIWHDPAMRHSLFRVMLPVGQ